MLFTASEGGEGAGLELTGFAVFSRWQVELQDSWLGFRNYSHVAFGSGTRCSGQ